MTEEQFDALVRMIHAFAKGTEFKQINSAVVNARNLLVKDDDKFTKEDYEAIYGWGGQG